MRRIALGTAQFGLAYGPAGREGRNPQVDADTVKRILAYARGAGVRTLDTAAAYGDCERVLGEIGVGDWEVVTKIPSAPLDCADLPSWMLSQVERSLKRLGIDRLHAVMLHEPALAVGDMAPVYARAIDRLRASGLVSKVGLSIYSPEILDRLAPVIWPDIVQMPFNVLDQRIRRSGWLTRLHSAGTELHARSVFLQGVLLMTAQDRPLFFSRWPTVFHAWDGLVESTGLTRLELAMGFALSEPNIDRIVVGVHGPSHLEEVLAAARRAPVGQGLAFDVDDDALLDPFRWALPR